MYEFDDYVTQMQLVKNKLVALGQCPPLRPMRSDTYQYLVEHILYSAFNKAKLKARVIEIYKDMIMSEEEPDLYDMVDTIDTENMTIIMTYYNSIDYSNDEIENIVAHYAHDIAPMLDDWVEDILKKDQLLFKGMSLMKVFQQNHDKINSVVDGEGQNVINPEWL